MVGLIFLSQPLLWTELKKIKGKKPQKATYPQVCITRISILRFSFTWILGPNLYRLCGPEKHKQNIHFQEPQIGWAFKVHCRSKYKWSLGKSIFSLDHEDLKVPRNIWLLTKSPTQGHRSHQWESAERKMTMSEPQRLENHANRLRKVEKENGKVWSLKTVLSGISKSVKCS